MTALLAREECPSASPARSPHDIALEDGDARGEPRAGSVGFRNSKRSEESSRSARPIDAGLALFGWLSHAEILSKKFLFQCSVVKLLFRSPLAQIVSCHDNNNENKGSATRKEGTNWKVSSTKQGETCFSVAIRHDLFINVKKLSITRQRLWPCSTQQQLILHYLLDSKIDTNLVAKVYAKLEPSSDYINNLIKSAAPRPNLALHRRGSI